MTKNHDFIKLFKFFYLTFLKLLLLLTRLLSFQMSIKLPDRFRFCLLFPIIFHYLFISWTSVYRDYQIIFSCPPIIFVFTISLYMSWWKWLKLNWRGQKGYNWSMISYVEDTFYNLKFRKIVNESLLHIFLSLSKNFKQDKNVNFQELRPVTPKTWNFGLGERFFNLFLIVF